MTDPLASFAAIEIDSIPLFSPDRNMTSLRKQLEENMRSNQGREAGEQEHPINYEAAVAMMLASNIQETCIRTKRDATVGLGFESEEERQAREKEKELSQRSHDMAMGLDSKPKAKPPGDPKQAVSKAASEPKSKSKVEEILDPLCGDHGFQCLMNQCGEDYENTGQCYMEVVREGTAIVGIWHMPSSAVKVFNETKKPFQHFVVHQRNGDLRYAAFGDLEDMQARNQINQEQVTELIHIKQPTSLHPDYGLPSWLSCTPWLELGQKVMQCDFDYFSNRAVPDLLVMLTGAKVPDADMKSLKEQIAGTVGDGKRYRSILANFPNPDTKALIERLNSDNREKFMDLWTMLQLQVVSTHRVPPLLAGVVLPGKMAAANELPNALVAFQTLYVQQHQRNFERRLGLTLGGADAGLGLTPEDFRLRKITDYYDIGQMDTMSRMRETVTEATQNGRKLEEGLKQ